MTSCLACSFKQSLYKIGHSDSGANEQLNRFSNKEQVSTKRTMVEVISWFENGLICLSTFIPGSNLYILFTKALSD